MTSDNFLYYKSPLSSQLLQLTSVLSIEAYAIDVLVSGAFIQERNQGFVTFFL